MDFADKLIQNISSLKAFIVAKLNLLKSYIDANEVKIGELEGMSLYADMAAQKIMLKNASGVLITEIGVGFLNNEGTTFFYNDSTEKLELRNDEGDVLSEVPASAFVSNLAQSIALSGANLNLKDTEGNVISSVTFQISNIDQLQEVLDLKVTQQDVNESIDNIEIGGRNLLPDSNFKYSDEEAQRWRTGGYNLVEVIDGKAVYTVTNFNSSARLDRSIILDKGVYTVAFKVNDINNSFRFSGLVNVTVKDTGQNVHTDLGYTIYWCTFLVENDNTAVRIRAYYGSSYQLDETFTVDWFNLQYGNKATDWSPNPEDKANENEVLHKEGDYALYYKGGINTNTNLDTLQAGYYTLATAVDRTTLNGFPLNYISSDGLMLIEVWDTGAYILQRITKRVSSETQIIVQRISNSNGDFSPWCRIYTDSDFTQTNIDDWNTVTDKANDNEVVHKNGDENINDTKTFSSQVRIENVNGVFVEASNGDTARYGSYGAYWSDAASGISGEFQFTGTGLSYFSNGNGIFKLHDYNNEDIADFLAARFSGRVQAEKAKNPDELVRLDQVETNTDSGWQSCTLNGTNTSSGTIEVKTKGSRLIVKGFYTGSSTGSGIVFTLPSGYVPDANRSVVSAVTQTQSKVFQIDSSNGAVFSEFESGVQFQVFFEMTKIIN